MIDGNERQEKRRKQLRLPNYDYSQNGAYYITICTHNRVSLFGIVKSVGAYPCVRPNAAGVMVKEKLFSLAEKYEGVKIDYYCIMPNHIHFVLVKEGAHAGAPLHEMIKWYKTQTTNEYIKLVKQNILPPFDKHIWQRNYYEHIIRGEEDLYEIRKYIENNPAKWFFDKYFHE